jgi:hypothetical protein
VTVRPARSVRLGLTIEEACLLVSALDCAMDFSRNGLGDAVEAEFLRKMGREAEWREQQARQQARFDAQCELALRLCAAMVRAPGR